MSTDNRPERISEMTEDERRSYTLAVHKLKRRGMSESKLIDTIKWVDRSDPLEVALALINARHERRMFKGRYFRMLQNVKNLVAQRDQIDEIERLKAELDRFVLTNDECLSVDGKTAHRAWYRKEAENVD